MRAGDKIIRVTTTTDYLVNFDEEGRSDINGWSLDQIKQDWFSKDRINRTHATRSACSVGGSVRLVGLELVEILNEQV